MNSAIRNFKNRFLKNKNYVQQLKLKQTNSNCKISNRTSKILKTTKGPRSPT